MSGSGLVSSGCDRCECIGEGCGGVGAWVCICGVGMMVILDVPFLLYFRLGRMFINIRLIDPQRVFLTVILKFLHNPTDIM